MGTNKRYPSRERAPQPPAPSLPPDWHPRRIARPVEWELHNGWPPDPLAVIRRIEIPEGNQVRVVFRAVTWAPTSEHRELIGYYPDGDAASAAAWHHFHDRHQLCRHG